MAVENNIRKFRVENGLTRPQLAELVGISWETIKAYEVGRSKPSLPVALRLAEVFECSVDEIFSLMKE